jgi:sugar lactone lactonase YvrE
MTEIHEFDGKTLCSTNSVLGEGPTYDPDTDTVWWFNILGKELHELNLSTQERKSTLCPPWRACSRASTPIGSCWRPNRDFSCAT